MKKIKKICVFGEDKRQIYLAKMLSDRGVVTIFHRGDASKEDLASFDCFLLPIPVTRDGYRLGCENGVLLMDLFEALPYGCSVIGGKIPQFFADHLDLKNIRICDFYQNEKYIWKNAEITAEGALMLLMRESEFALKELKLLVCGYGRIGKCLSRMLGMLGADVTVAARKKEVIFEAEVCGGFKTKFIEELDTNERYDAIFNTVPAEIFNEKNIDMLEKAIYIELASAPYGGESEVIEKNCKKYILASGLPGKYAPRSDATAAFEVVSRHIFEEERI